MKKIAAICLAAQILCGSLWAQMTDITPTSPSIAHTSVADTRKWSAFANPAMIGYRTNYELGIMYENKFLVPELAAKSMYALIPHPKINTGISFSYFGYSLYHYSIVGIGWSKDFGHQFSIGLQTDLYRLYSVATHSQHNAFLPQIGLSLRLSTHCSMGFHTFNPFQTKIEGEYVSMKLPSLFSLGVEYEFSHSLYAHVQADRELGTSYRSGASIEYDLIPQVQIKAGAYQSDYLVPCLGVAIHSYGITADFDTEIHPILGVNPVVSIRYQFAHL